MIRSPNEDAKTIELRVAVDHNVVFEVQFSNPSEENLAQFLQSSLKMETSTTLSNEEKGKLTDRVFYSVKLSMRIEKFESVLSGIYH